MCIFVSLCLSDCIFVSVCVIVSMFLSVWLYLCDCVCVIVSVWLYLCVYIKFLVNNDWTKEYFLKKGRMHLIMISTFHFLFNLLMKKNLCEKLFKEKIVNNFVSLIKKLTRTAPSNHNSVGKILIYYHKNLINWYT